MDAAFLRLFFFTLGTCVRNHELFHPFMVSCDDKGKLILSGAKERDLV